MCDALQTYMVNNKLTVTDTTTASTAYTEGLQCITKYKSNCSACYESPYTAECLYCLQFECSVTPGKFCCPQLKEAMACDDHLCHNQNTVRKSSLLIPVWAIIVIVLGTLFLIGFGLIYYYKSQIKSNETKLF
jgi:hypothetical protein